MVTKKLKNNKDKIILATILSFIFTAAFFVLYRNAFTVVLADQTEQTFSLEGSGTADNPYKISTAQDLISFSDYVNGGNVSVNAVLTSDIVLNEKVVTDEGFLTNGDLKTFSPIGNACNIFCGTFDGQGFTVSGLYYSDETKLYVGLFGRIGEKGIVKNVNVKDSYFLARQHVGGIVGDNGGNVENCTFDGIIVATFEGLGGIAGGNFGTIKNSRNYALVEGGACVNVDTYTTKDKDGNVVTKTTTKNWLCEAIGGIAGANYGYIETSENYGNVSGGANLGGVTGFNNLSIKNSFNKGNVTSKATSTYAYLGGIAGYNSIIGTISDCYNSGDVYSDRHDVGGIVGCTEAHGPLYVKNCYNAGAVTGGIYVGGIIGYSQVTVKNCYNLGTISGTRYVGGISGYSRVRKNDSASLTYCYNVGDVVDKGAAHVDFGSITGGNNGMIVENCYYLDNDDNIADTNKGAVVKSTDEFKSGTVSYLLNKGNDNDVWRQNIGIDDYPNFTSSRVYFDEESGLAYNHVHVWEYSFENNVLSAVCTLADCTETDGGSLTVKLPTNLTYDGAVKEAVIVNNLKDEPAYDILYTSKDYDLSAGEKPKKVGEYTLDIIIGKNTFSVTFVILSAEIEGIDRNAISQTSGITAENVTFDDEKALILSKNGLTKALNDYSDNYTPSELIVMTERLETVDAALDVLSRVKNVCDFIMALPDDIETENVDSVNAAKKAYDNLTDYEKTLIGSENTSKLQKSIEASEKIVSANENYENGDTEGVFGKIFALIIAFIGILIFILTLLF